MLGRKEKATQVKQTRQLEEINQRLLAKEGCLKRCRDKAKQYIQTKHSKTTKKNLPASWERRHKDITTG